MLLLAIRLVAANRLVVCNRLIVLHLLIGVRLLLMTDRLDAARNLVVIYIYICESQYDCEFM